MGSYRVLTLFVFFVDGVVGDSSGLTLLSVMEGRPVTLNTGVTKQQRDKMLWYFNDTLIALINGDPSTSCLYDGEDGRFRDRVKVDYETGSLTIRDIRSEHAGRYEANFIQSKSSGTSQSLNRNSKCDSTKITRKMSNIGDTIKTFIVSISPSLSVPDKIDEELDETEKERESDRSSVLMPVTVAVICAVAVLMSVTVGVIYYRHRRSINGKYHIQTL
ncbi:uncharacterized protein LOC130086918 [Rhinichthys klamathensis goyatoka]|uniref:uncharacterized protein LOC130086918 n=1 Tax=Rhinichthys klamathensis goyatoka TaxID=3034132 RepID=UPI0024B57F4D|nr:uncharacterized protein LOC130086918 [Rhinichthys klamathensis goyatoka]